LQVDAELCDQRVVWSNKRRSGVKFRCTLNLLLLCVTQRHLQIYIECTSVFIIFGSDNGLSSASVSKSLKRIIL